MKKHLYLFVAAAFMLSACEQGTHRTQESALSSDQAEKESDRLLAQKLKQSLLSDPNLSQNAKNIRIIVLDAKVTLKGTAANDQEKSALLNKARNMQDVKSVDDQIEVVRR